ncbi:CD151 antigen [Venturia canescens]|uniref:CD151 antigen n=1 Tax=Venturia canescens TaxID=32260 RepID=UPI001C9CA76F|nr:CD151 antigen [Venturia canescens]
MGYSTAKDTCAGFMKWALFLSNITIFIGGLIVTGLAIWALVDRVSYIAELLGNDLLTGAIYVLLVGGIIVAVIAFLGCIGACREVKCMLLTYCIIMLVLFVTMFIGGVLGYVFRSKVLDVVEQQMTNSLRLTDPSTRNAWDMTQKTLHCCGVKSYRDWASKGLPIPDSCCREISAGKYFRCNTAAETPNASNIWVDGCLNSTKIYIQRHAAAMGASGIAIACVMLFCMIFSCALFNMIE